MNSNSLFFLYAGKTVSFNLHNNGAFSYLHNHMINHLEYYGNAHFIFKTVKVKALKEITMPILSLLVAVSCFLSIHGLQNSGNYRSGSLHQKENGYPGSLKEMVQRYLELHEAGGKKVLFQNCFILSFELFFDKLRSCKHTRAYKSYTYLNQ